MPQLARRLFAAAALPVALSLALSACVVDPALMGGTPTASSATGVKTADLPKQAQLIEGVYSAKADPQFNVPAIPAEKVPTQFQRQTVAYASDQPVGTIIINPAAKHLYLVTGKNSAVRYGIAVGKAGFQWSGEALITGRKNWPTWTPPKDMISRKPELARWSAGQPGGLSNPLGARALYLTTNGVDYGYRIHGTPDWNTIGKNASSGCIRMINQDVMDLFDRVPNNTKVIVLNSDGSMPKGLTLPPPQKRTAAKAAAKPAPAVASPAIIVPKPAVMPAPVITMAPPAGMAPATQTPATQTPVTQIPASQVAVPSAPAAAVPAAATDKTPAAAAAPVCAVALVNGACPSN